MLGARLQLTATKCLVATAPRGTEVAAIAPSLMYLSSDRVRQTIAPLAVSPRSTMTAAIGGRRASNGGRRNVCGSLCTAAHPALRGAHSVIAAQGGRTNLWPDRPQARRPVKVVDPLGQREITRVEDRRLSFVRGLGFVLKLPPSSGRPWQLDANSSSQSSRICSTPSGIADPTKQVGRR